MNRCKEYEQFKAEVLGDYWNEFTPDNTKSDHPGSKGCPACGGTCIDAGLYDLWQCTNCGESWMQCMVCEELGHSNDTCSQGYIDPMTREMVRTGENAQLSQTDAEPEPEDIGLDDVAEPARPVIANSKAQVMRRAESMGLTVEDGYGEISVDAPRGYKFRANDSGTTLCEYNSYFPKSEAWAQIYSDLDQGMYPSTDAGYDDDSTTIWNASDATEIDPNDYRDM